jgi:hypothetical protein
MSSGMDETDGMLWNDSEEDGNVGGEFEEDGTYREDGDSDTDW